MNAVPAAPVRWPRLRAVATFPLRMGPPTEHWRATRFGGLAIVHYFSSAGDALVSVALAGSVFVSVSLHAARGRTALGLLCTLLPFAIVGPILGPAIDRIRGGRRFVIFVAAIGRLVACLMMAAWINSLLLFPAAFLSLVFSKTHAVARASLVPGTVDTQSDLVRANAKLAVGSSVVTAAVAGVGALIYKLFGSKALLDCDVVVFAVTAVTAITLLSPARPVAGGAEASSNALGAWPRCPNHPWLPPPTRSPAPAPARRVRSERERERVRVPARRRARRGGAGRPPGAAGKVAVAGRPDRCSPGAATGGSRSRPRCAWPACRWQACEPWRGS